MDTENIKKDISVLMISSDPAFFSVKVGTGNAVERHLQYADRVQSLDIIVFGGDVRDGRKVSKKLTIHPTGVRGARNILRARKISREIIKRKKIDLIVTQDPHATGLIGMYLKKKYRIPLIINIHGDFWNNAQWRKERMLHVLKDNVQKRTAPVADGIRVVSDGIKADLVKFGLPQEQIRIIHTPINVRQFVQLDSDQNLLIQKMRYKYGEKFILLFCGRLVAAKNLHFILDVVDQLKKRRQDFFLFVIGEGEQKAELEKKIIDYRLDPFVSLLGSKTHSDLVVYYHLADLLLLLSTNESFGKVIIEAGLAETPCLASATTGAQHIIQDGSTGFMVPINDLESTVDVLEEMIEYREQSKEMGIRAKELYQTRYATEKTISAIIKFWQEIARQ